MNKPWIGYVSSALLLLAGVSFFMAGETGLGVLFCLVAGASAVLNVYIGKKTGK